MKKIILSIFIYLFTLQCYSQVSFQLNNVTANNSDIFKVEVTVQNFVDILSMQFSINWPATELEFVSVGDFNCSDLTNTDFGLVNVSSGKLALSWVEGALAGVTKPDGTIIFSVTFKAIGSGSSNPVSISNVPTAIEIYDVLSNIVPYVVILGTVTINEVPITGKTITIPDAGIISELEVELPIFTSVLSAADQITDVSFNLSFSSDLLTYKSYLTAGTLLSGASVVITPVSAGLLNVVINSSAIITGSGALIKLRFNVLKSGSSSIIISDFKYGASSVTDIKGVTTLYVDQLKGYSVKLGK